MAEENKGQESRLKNIDETKNYFIEVIKRNELMRKKNNKIYTILNYIGYLLILASVVTGFVSISAFASLVITSSTIELKIYAITAKIEMYQSVIKKKKKKNDKIQFLAKAKLNSIKVLISEALFDSYISHDRFLLVNIV